MLCYNYQISILLAYNIKSAILEDEYTNPNGNDTRARVYIHNNIEIRTCIPIY